MWDMRIYLSFKPWTFATFLRHNIVRECLISKRERKSQRARIFHDKLGKIICFVCAIKEALLKGCNNNALYVYKIFATFNSPTKTGRAQSKQSMPRLRVFIWVSPSLRINPCTHLFPSAHVHKQPLTASFSSRTSTTFTALELCKQTKIRFFSSRRCQLLPLLRFSLLSFHELRARKS